MCGQAAGSDTAARVRVLLRHDGVWKREKKAILDWLFGGGRVVMITVTGLLCYD